MFRLHGSAAPAIGPPPPPPPPVETRCRVPRVVGRTLGRAATLILRAHCRVGRVARRHSVRRKRGRCLLRAPRAGRSLELGSRASTSSSAAAKRLDRSGVSASSEPSTTSASESASAPGGKTRFGIATTRMPGGRGRAHPVAESSIAAQRPAATSSRAPPPDRRPGPACRVRPPPRRPYPEQLLRSGELEEEVDQRPVRRGGDARAASARRIRRTASIAPSTSGSFGGRAPPVARRLLPRSDPAGRARRSRRACTATTRASSCPSSPAARRAANARHARQRSRAALRPTAPRCRGGRRRGRRRPPRSRVRPAQVNEGFASRPAPHGDRLAYEQRVVARPHVRAPTGTRPSRARPRATERRARRPSSRSPSSARSAARRGRNAGPGAPGPRPGR